MIITKTLMKHAILLASMSISFSLLSQTSSDEPSSLDQISESSTSNEVNPALAQRVINQLKALDVTLESIGLAVNAKIAKVEDKKIVAAHILSLREMLAYYIGTYGPNIKRGRFERASLESLLSVNEGMLSYIQEAMDNGFTSIDQFDEGTLVKRNRLASLTPEELVLQIDECEEQIRQLDAQIKKIGYSYLNLISKRVAHYDKRLKLSTIAYRSLPYLGLGLYCAAASGELPDWGPIKPIKDFFKEEEEPVDVADMNMLSRFSRSFKHIIRVGTGHRVTDGAVFNIAAGGLLAKVLYTDITDLAQWSEREIYRRGVAWFKGVPFDDGLPIKRSKLFMSDIIGAEHAKKELGRIIDYYKARSTHDRAGAYIDRGYLLVGPLDTCRSLAFAIAGDVTANYKKEKNKSTEMSVYDIHSSELITKDLKTIIKEAGEKFPCIVLIEDLDWLHEQPRVDAKVWSDIASSMNCILKSKKQVFVIATTRNASVLSSHHKGNVGMVIQVDMPTEADRMEHFKREFEKRSILTSRFDLASLARNTNGCTFIQITNVINRALNIAQSKGTILDQAHLEEAINEAIHGIVIKTPEEHDRKMLAAHYAGKVVAHKVLLPEEQVKVTIYPVIKQGKTVHGALISYAPKTAPTDAMIKNECVIDLAGVAAQKFLMGTESSAISQLDAIQARIKKMVLEGIDEKHLSQASTEKKLQEAEKIFVECSAKAVQLIQKHEHTVKAVAKELEEQFILNDSTIENLLSDPI